jgi:uncharacterized protein (TIGR02145 family)
MKKNIRSFLIFSIVLIVQFTTIPAYSELPINSQPLTDFKKLFDTYEMELEKSQFETMAQYENRIKIFLADKPVYYFDISVDTYYDAESQTLYLYQYDYSYREDLYSKLEFPTFWELFKLSSSYNTKSSHSIYRNYYLHDIVISNPDVLEIKRKSNYLSEWEYPVEWIYPVVQISSMKLTPSVAQKLSENYKVRIGMKFNYRTGGILEYRQTSYSSYPLYWYNYNHVMVGELQTITLYDETDNTIYWQKNIAASVLIRSTTVLTATSPSHTITTGTDGLVYGTASSNQIVLESGVRAELINFPGQNSIQIQSDSNLFRVSRSGTIVTFQGSDGTVLKIPATTDPQTIAFTGEESRVLQIHNGQVMLDDQVITTNSASPIACGAYVAPDVWKEFDCYNLAAIGKATGDDPFTPSWRLIGGYWQWGRKGPDSSQWYDTNTEHFAHGPTGPGAGDANSGEIRNWDDKNAPDGAWSDNEKTANDPCPAGYRVPTKNQWAGVLENNIQSTVGTWSTMWDDHTNYNSARFFGNDLMLPAAGARYSYSGALYDRGDTGYDWSSSESGSSNASGLYFLSGSALTNGYGTRLSGRSVRCISE